MHDAGVADVCVQATKHVEGLANELEGVARAAARTRSRALRPMPSFGPASTRASSGTNADR